MRSDIAPGGTFEDYELLALEPAASYLKYAGDLSPFHGWNRRVTA